MRPRRRAGALVEPIVHPVAVGVRGATTRVRRGTDGRVGTRIPPVGDSVVVRVRRRAAAGEDGQAEGADDVTRPVSARESRVGRVEATHLEAEGGVVAEKDPVADRAVDGVVGEAVGSRLLEVEPGVAAEDIEEVAGRSEIEDQAGAAVGQCGRAGACLRVGALVARVELRADDVGEEVA